MIEIGYFMNKKYGTASNIASEMTNMIKDYLESEKGLYDRELYNHSSEFKQQSQEDERFSGSGVESIVGVVNEEYEQYNRQYRYRYQEILNDRKSLFNMR